MRTKSFVYVGFYNLIIDAAEFAIMAGSKDLHCRAFAEQRFARASILMSVLSLECAANRCLDSLPIGNKCRDDLDKLSILGKYDVFLSFRNNKKIMDRGIDVVHKIQELKNIRDSIVHPKRISGEIVQTYVEFHKTDNLKLAKLHLLWKIEDALSAFRAVMNFYNYYFIELCNMTGSEVGHILLSSTTNSQGQIEPSDPFDDFVQLDRALKDVASELKSDLKLFSFMVQL